MILTPPLSVDLTEEVMDDNSVGLDGVPVDIPIKVAKNRKIKKKRVEKEKVQPHTKKEKQI